MSNYELLKESLSIAVEALEKYSNRSNWDGASDRRDVLWEFTESRWSDGWAVADDALEKIWDNMLKVVEEYDLATIEVES